MHIDFRSAPPTADSIASERAMLLCDQQRADLNRSAAFVFATACGLAPVIVSLLATRPIELDRLDLAGILGAVIAILYGAMVAPVPQVEHLLAPIQPLDAPRVHAAARRVPVLERYVQAVRAQQRDLTIAEANLILQVVEDKLPMDALVSLRRGDFTATLS